VHAEVIPVLTSNASSRIAKMSKQHSFVDRVYRLVPLIMVKAQQLLRLALAALHNPVELPQEAYLVVAPVLEALPGNGQHLLGDVAHCAISKWCPEACPWHLHGVCRISTLAGMDTAHTLSTSSGRMRVALCHSLVDTQSSKYPLRHEQLSAATA
jgi:hypothetical protein